MAVLPHIHAMYMIHIINPAIPNIRGNTKVTLSQAKSKKPIGIPTIVFSNSSRVNLICMLFTRTYTASNGSDISYLSHYPKYLSLASTKIQKTHKLARPFHHSNKLKAWFCRERCKLKLMSPTRPILCM